MSTILLVRHAVTAATGKRLGGRTTAPLDDRGQAQAESVAERLAGLPIKAVYTSPLPRTRQTATAIADRHGLEPVDEDGLLEVEYGRWTDRPLAQVAKTKLWPVIQQRPSLVEFPDGESIRGAQLRAVDAVERLVAAHRRDVVVVVSHADVIKLIVAFYLSQPIDGFQRLHVPPASVTALQLVPHGVPMLLRLGDDGPLSAGAIGARPGKGGARRG